MAKPHVFTFKVMSPGPNNFVVTVTAFDAKNIDQVRSDLLSQKQAKKLEKALRMAINDKVLTIR